ncbi:MAG TPA: hypothetical protein VGG95_12820, partial [Edaphobacter sp.]
LLLVPRPGNASQLLRVGKYFRNTFVACPVSSKEPAFSFPLNSQAGFGGIDPEFAGYLPNSIEIRDFPKSEQAPVETT